jgi:hypothetical protein
MTEQQAKQRFLILNLVRLSNLGGVIMGVLLISGKIVDDAMIKNAGYIFVVVGAAGFFGIPVLLKSIWQKQDK